MALTGDYELDIFGIRAEVQRLCDRAVIVEAQRDEARATRDACEVALKAERSRADRLTAAHRRRMEECAAAFVLQCGNRMGILLERSPRPTHGQIDRLARAAHRARRIACGEPAFKPAAPPNGGER